MELHSEQENFRRTLAARTPESERATLIVMRRKQYVWLTFDGAIRTTVTMTNPETTQLIDLLHEAQGRAMPEQAPLLTATITMSIALRRVSRGGVAKLADHYLGRGRPVPCFLSEVLNELIEAGLTTLSDPEPDNAGQCLAALTEAGKVQYAALTEPQELQ